ncbi:MAG: flavin-containing monooxygenase [Acidimicrobiales bacterium]
MRGARRSIRILIIGAGPGGICAAKELKEAGFNDVVLLEKTAGVGGTWNINRYPGCACDVQCHLYSFSFAIKPDWSRPYPPQAEILAYMEDLAATYGVLDHCRFGTEVVRAAWDDTTATWRLDLSDGDVVEADVLISALGMFKEPTPPVIDGLGGFTGTMFHSSRWRFDHDLTGRTVGVIGSAASAVQFVPEIAKTAGHVYLFQRTANWVLPKPDTPYTEEQLEEFRRDPGIVRRMRDEIYRSMDEGMTFSDPAVLAEREAIGLAAIDVVEDGDTRAKLRPDHPFGCKRPLFSNLYYQAFNRPNLELVTEPIDRVNPDGILTVDGVERRVDTLVLATGFTTTRYASAIDIVGRHGRTLAEAWSDGAHAYLGIVTAGFPNLFMIYGPNTNNGSILTMIESQVAHIVAQVERMAGESLAWVDVTSEAEAAYNHDVQQAIGGVAVWQAACNGYYRTPSGRVVTQWPFSMSEFRDRTAVVDTAAFAVGVRSVEPVVAMTSVIGAEVDHDDGRPSPASRGAE